MATKKAVAKSRKPRAQIGAAHSGLSFPIAAIGASAGGLGAFSALLKALSPRSGMAFVLIQHLEPKHESALASLLARATAMPVVEVSNGMTVEPNHIYVIPPDKNLTIRRGTLRLAPRSNVSGLQHPIDDFFVALAEEQGNAAIGVVCSGTGSDGTVGLRAIKAAGGVTFAQDPKTAQWPSMPMNAIAAGSVDFVLSPKRIAAELIRIARHPWLTEAREVPEGSDLDKICLDLRSSLGVDFRLYKPATLRRRIARRMALRKIASLHKYEQFLQQNPDEAKALADDIFIHVTSFFRDPECFQALRKRVLAKLCLKRPADVPLRIWVPGCSTGEEVYSIAMLALEELGERANRIRIQIFGTDIQERPIEHARAGIYTAAAVEGVSAVRLKRFFIKADHGFRIQKFVRDLCIFARHDLAGDPSFSRMDLISCRNVLIYMGTALQKRILSNFQYALKPGGFLFLGKSESISDSDIFTADDRKHRIFLRKPATPALRALPFNTGQFRAPEAPSPATLMPGASGDFRKETEAVLLEHYTPPALIVDPDLHIVHFQGDVSPYLGPATGQPSFHLLKMVRPELVVDLRTAIYKARKEGSTVHKDGVQFEHRGHPAAVRLEVRPLGKRNGKKNNLLIVFQAERPGPEESARIPAALTKRPPERTERLERELASTREHLRALIAEHEIAQEEMKAANEEILSSNEELQSTNEELETAQEELQSSNEELITLNEELQHRNADLSTLTNDLNNLLVGVDIPVLVLDADLRVRRFTPTAATLLNLIPGDVGRPFSNIASTLDVPDWKDLFAEVTDHGQSVEREVSDRNGHRYSLRARPYRTIDNRIEGVLLVMLDTDLIFRARDKASDYARVIVETIHDALVVLDEDLHVLTANQSFYDLFRLSPQNVGQQPPFFAPPLRQLLRDVLAKGAEIKDFELDQDFREIGRRRLVINAHQIYRTQTILIAIEDVTEQKRLEQIAQAHAQEIQALAASLLTAQEEERRRVSRELHDEIGQQLASLAIDIGGLAADAPHPEDAQSRLRALQSRVVKASEVARHIAYELHPSVLDDLGLVTSLRSLCKEFSDRSKNIALEFTDVALPASLPREVSSCLYRVAQESLQNISRHANAKHVSVVLALRKRNIMLTIADDGAGFDPEAVKGRGGLGLIGMEERARLVDGKFSIATKPGKGARIAVEVPLPASTP